MLVNFITDNGNGEYHICEDFDPLYKDTIDTNLLVDAKPSKDHIWDNLSKEWVFSAENYAKNLNESELAFLNMYFEENGIDPTYEELKAYIKSHEDLKPEKYYRFDYQEKVWKVNEDEQLVFVKEQANKELLRILKFLTVDCELSDVDKVLAREYRLALMELIKPSNTNIAFPLCPNCLKEQI